MHSKLASKPVFMGSKIFFDSSKIFKPSNANLSQLNEGKLSSSKTKRVKPYNHTDQILRKNCQALSQMLTL